MLDPEVPQLDSAFDVVGLDSTARLAYRYVLSKGTVQPVDVTNDVTHEDEDTLLTLESLRAAGLVSRSRTGEQYTAVDPRTAVRTLADRTASRLDTVRSAIPRLAEVYEQAESAHVPTAHVRVVHGAAAIGAWYTRLQHEATEEFLQFDRPPYVLAEENPVEPHVLARGVVWRVVYATEALERPGAWTEMRYAMAQGERARIAPTVPTKLAVADRRIALVSPTLDPQRPTAVVIEDRALIDVLCTAFEAVWEEAVEIPAASDDLDDAAPSRRGPTRDDLVFLALLASGAKDETIARELGIADRTLRRRTSDLLRRLGASSRFQAGVQASRRGWI